MAWLIGLVCVILVIVFWRIFLPLSVIAAVALALFFVFLSGQQEKQRKAEEVAAQALRARIARAQQNETSVDKEWQVYYEPDPANKMPVARTAMIQSDDGLCVISVEKRVNGTELTGLTCPGIHIPSYNDIDVKFDSMETSQKMRLETYSNSQDVYIPLNQYNGYLSYKLFVDMLSTANSLAINIPASETFWTRFKLHGAAEAIRQLGKPKETESNRQG
jgi:hypothetical protein